MALKLVVGNPLPSRVGGAENSLFRFLRHVDRKRFDPHVVCFDFGPFVEELRSLGFPCDVVPTRRLRHGGRYVSAVRKLRGVLQRERPDVMLAWGQKAQVYFGSAAALSGLSSRNVWMTTFNPFGAAHKLAHALPAEAVLCPSKFIAAAHAHLLPRRRVVVIPRGVDRPSSPRATELKALSESLGLPPGRMILGNVGRLVPHKGQDRFLEAIAELRSRGHEVHGLIVGGDDPSAPDCGPRLRSLVDELNLADRVSFAGQVPDASPYLFAMDICVSSAPAEPFGNWLIEAMACGVPVVAVSGGGPAEIVEHERSGLLVQDAAPESLASGIERLLQDEALRSRLADGGQQRYLERFTVERMVHDISAFLEDVAQRA